MRLPLLSSSDLTSNQPALYEDMRHGIESNFKGFKTINGEGALIGPWNPWLHFAKFGGPMLELVKALSTSPTLPRPVREVAILVTGAHFHSDTSFMPTFWSHRRAVWPTQRSRPSWLGSALLT